MQTRLDRVARRARTHRSERFNNLFHLLDVELMAVCFEELKEDRAPGVDGVTKEEYAEGLEQKLHHLVERLHRRSYRPQPTRRKMIPKANGKMRPLGIPTIEDKLVQRGVARVLEQIYEEDFHPFSFGFRPGKGCHDALKELSRNIGTKKVGYVVEADIKGFFDNVDHDKLLEMLAHRVNDPGVLWLVRRFLRADVMVEGKRLDTEKGTPQGGVISPLLANVYLHHVLDEWFAKAVRPQCRGEVYLVRYADDFVACFQHEDDARRFHDDLPRRLGKFGLEVEPSKTRMLPFGRFARRDAERRGERVGVFDFLGFTHHCGLRRTSGSERGAVAIGHGRDHEAPPRKQAGTADKCRPTVESAAPTRPKLPGQGTSLRSARLAGRSPARRCRRHFAWVRGSINGVRRGCHRWPTLGASEEELCLRCHPPAHRSWSALLMLELKGQRAEAARDDDIDRTVGRASLYSCGEMFLCFDLFVSGEMALMDRAPTRVAWSSQ